MGSVLVSGRAQSLIDAVWNTTRKEGGVPQRAAAAFRGAMDLAELRRDLLVLTPPPVAELSEAIDGLITLGTSAMEGMRVSDPLWRQVLGLAHIVVDAHLSTGKSAAGFALADLMIAKTSLEHAPDESLRFRSLYAQLFRLWRRYGKALQECERISESLPATDEWAQWATWMWASLAPLHDSRHSDQSAVWLRRLEESGWINGPMRHALWFDGWASYALGVGDPDMALSANRKALGRFQEAEADGRALGLNLEIQGLARWQAGDHSLALTVFRDAKRCLASALSPAPLVDECVLLIECLKRGEMYNEALGCPLVRISHRDPAGD